MLNTKLLSNPFNWVIVLSFVVIGCALLREVTRAFQVGQSVVPSVPGGT